MKSFSAKIYLIILLSLLLSGCGYTRMATMDRKINSHWDKVQECFEDRRELVENLLVSGDREFTPGLILNRIEQDMEDLQSYTVLPGESDSLKQYLKLQQQLADDLAMLINVHDFFENNDSYIQDQFVHELEQNNQSLEQLWSQWLQSREGFNQYIDPFPRGIIAQWLGFKPYEYLDLDLDSLQVELP